MRKLRRYNIISNDNVVLFEDEINDFINEGFEPCGEIKIIKDKSDNFNYYLAMAKYDDYKEEEC
jgi:transposase-like protein